MNVAAHRKIAPINSTPPAERTGNDRVKLAPPSLHWMSGPPPVSATQTSTRCVNIGCSD